MYYKVRYQSIFIFIDLITLFGIDMLESGCRRLGRTMQGAPTEALTFISRRPEIGVIRSRESDGFKSGVYRMTWQTWIFSRCRLDLDFGFCVRHENLTNWAGIFLFYFASCEHVNSSLSYFRSPRTQSGKL